MSTILHPCMGGWCQIREDCANYHQSGVMVVGKPHDRLCVKGEDGTSEIAIVKPLSQIELEEHRYGKAA